MFKLGFIYVFLHTTFLVDKGYGGPFSWLGLHAVPSFDYTIHNFPFAVYLFFQGKGHLEEVPLDKRRRLGRDTPAMGRLAVPSLRGRRALSDANAGQVVGESMGNASSNNEGCGTEDGGLVEFRKEDVNALLNEKIKGKTKFDFKVCFLLLFPVKLSNGVFERW